MTESLKKQHTPEARKTRKTLKGLIVSDTMKDTAVILVERYIKHPKYGKFMRLRKKYKVHNAGNKYKLGERVIAEECRPISRHKRFTIIETLSPAPTLNSQV